MDLEISGVSSPVMYCRPQSPGSSFAMQISQNRTQPASFLLIERSLYLQAVLSCKQRSECADLNDDKC